MKYMSELYKLITMLSVVIILSLFSIATSYAEEGRVVGVDADNLVWGNSGTTITFDPDSGGPNTTCDIYGSEFNGFQSSIAGAMALIAMKYDNQFSTVSFECVTGSSNFIEMSLAGSGNQVYFYHNDGVTYEWYNINGVYCFTPSAGSANKVALAIATNHPMTATCAYNQYVGENILHIAF